MAQFVTDLINRIASKVGIDDETKGVLLRTGQVLLLRSVGVGCTFGFNVLLGRRLGADGTGVFFEALTVTTVAAVIGRAGLDNVLLRVTAAGAAQNNWPEVAGVSRQGLRIAAGLSGFATLVIIIIAGWLAQVVFHSSTLIIPLLVMSLCIVPQSLTTLYGELLRGLHQIHLTVFVQDIGIPFLSLLFLGILGHRASVIGAAGAYLLSSYLIMIAAAILWKYSTPYLKRVRGEFELQRMFAAGLPLFILSLMNLVIGASATFFLGLWRTTAEIGIFNIATRIAIVSSFILGAVNTIIAPKFAILYQQKDHQALGKVARDTSKIMTVVSAPLTLILILYSEAILRLFGNEFAAGAVVLAILAVGQFINVVTGSVGNLLLMTGHERLVRNKVVFSLMLNTVLLIILIKAYGILGAAIGTALTVAIDNLLSVWIAYRKLSIITLPIPDFPQVLSK